MANEKVSQMTSLTAVEAALDDLLMVVDTSARESKKITLADALTFIESTGSFNAIHAINSDTASYIVGSNVKGAVLSASFADTTVSASNSVRSDLARTASFALNVVTGSGFSLTTGSTYQITASAAVSSSYTVNSTFASSSFVAQNLQYSGVPNGTASFAISSSNALTSSFALISNTANNVVSASFATTASFASFASNMTVRAWAWVTWSLGVNVPQLYRSNNVSSIRYLGTTSGCSGQVNWNKFGVSFITPLDSDQYMLDGTTISGIDGCGFNAHILIGPTYARSVNGFTMSVAVDSTFTTYFTTTTGSATFEIYV